MKKGSLSQEIKNMAINDYLNGMSYREVATKYNINHKTVRYWVLYSGNKSRSKDDANILMSKKTKGQRRSIETEFKKGVDTWNKNTKGIMKPNQTSFKTGEHPSMKTEFKKGKENLNYIDGRSWVRYPPEFGLKLKNNIRKRDSYCCQNCGMNENEHLEIYHKRLDIHHINYNKKDCDESNLITLCKQCNQRANYNRAYWELFYKTKTNISKYG
jgi:hypothetical protein